MHAYMLLSDRPPFSDSYHKLNVGREIHAIGFHDTANIAVCYYFTEGYFVLSVESNILITVIIESKSECLQSWVLVKTHNFLNSIFLFNFAIKSKWTTLKIILKKILFENPKVGLWPQGCYLKLFTYTLRSGLLSMPHLLSYQLFALNVFVQNPLY